jgi:hypothetical protein
MSSQSTTTRPIIYLGMDVHKESITIAVLPADAKTPTRVDRLPNDLPKLKRYVEPIARDGQLRVCYEASGAGYVLHRALTESGYACEVIAPSLIPKRPGVQRKHDKRDASDLARLSRSGELTPVRIPTEAEERVRDVVRRQTTGLWNDRYRHRRQVIASIQVVRRDSRFTDAQPGDPGMDGVERGDRDHSRIANAPPVPVRWRLCGLPDTDSVTLAGNRNRRRAHFDRGRVGPCQNNEPESSADGYRGVATPAYCDAGYEQAT